MLRSLPGLLSLPGVLLVLVLAMLLTATTPVGTGQGVHQGELLHPVLPHLHLVDGRLVTHEQLAQALDAASLRRPPAPATKADTQPSQTPDQGSSQQAGPALGAGSPADAPGLGLASSPNPPSTSFSLPLFSFPRLGPADGPAPTEFRDTPQDPPPNDLA